MSSAVTHSKKLSMLALASMLLLALSFAAPANASDGFIEVSTTAEFLAIKSDLTGKYRLTADIDLAGSTWSNASVTFEGELDGNGKTITGFSSTIGGLFYVIESQAKVYDLTLSGIDVNQTRNDATGGLADYNDGLIQNVTISGDVKGNSEAGGVVGANFGTVSGVSSTVNITGTDGDVGGLVGYNEGDVENSTVKANVHGVDSLGGLIGYHGDGNLSGSTVLTGTIVVGTGDYVGGAVGTSKSQIASTTVQSGVTVTGNKYVGGLVGGTNSKVSGSTSRASVTSSESPAACLVAVSEGQNSAPIIENSYGYGVTTAGGTKIYGLVGEKRGDEPVITGSAERDDCKKPASPPPPPPPVTPPIPVSPPPTPPENPKCEYGGTYPDCWKYCEHGWNTIGECKTPPKPTEPTPPPTTTEVTTQTESGELPYTGGTYLWWTLGGSSAALAGVARVIINRRKKNM